jgi:hypothetical protein
MFFLSSIIDTANELLARWLLLVVSSEPTWVRTLWGEDRGVAPKKTPHLSHVKAQI